MKHMHCVALILALLALFLSVPCARLPKTTRIMWNLESSLAFRAFPQENYQGNVFVFLVHGFSRVVPSAGSNG